MEWNENLNQAFSQAWGQLGEGGNGEEVPGDGQDMNNNNNRQGREDLNNNNSEERVGAEVGVQNVWGEASFREGQDQMCPVTEGENNQDESRQRGN